VADRFEPGAKGLKETSGRAGTCGYIGAAGSSPTRHPKDTVRPSGACGRREENEITPAGAGHAAMTPGGPAGLRRLGSNQK
jgi:hypothetical protein